MINWQHFRQNHPELIIRDLADHVNPELTRFILKKRGVNKWFAVRRLLIQLKDRWKNRITELEISLYNNTKSKHSREWNKGYLQALRECRQQVRSLCHSPRNVDFSEHIEWPSESILPTNFPSMPSKKYFHKKHNV